MTATCVPMNYISIDENGTAIVTGTGVKIRTIAGELIAGHRPEDIKEAHNELSMAQVHGALAYYYANKSEFDEQIERVGTGTARSYGSADEELADEHKWQSAFSKSKDVLRKAAERASAERRQGKTRPLESILDKHS